MRFRHVLRRLLQSPLFTITSVITLALGIGANAAIFSVIEGILLKPLAYTDPDRLIALDHTRRGLTCPASAWRRSYTLRIENRIARWKMWESGKATVSA